MSNISKHFTWAEFEKSNTATRLGIDNSVPQEHKHHAIALFDNIVQPTRDALGLIRLSSGYRSDALNKAIGGSHRSQHSKGQAVDMDNDNIKVAKKNKDIFHFIKDNLTFDQLIWEFGNENNPAWVHVSYRNDGKNRKQILQALKIKGKTQYKPWT